MKLKQLICLLLAALLLGACGSPAAPTEATEETKPTDAGLDPVVPSDAVESSEKPEPVEDLTVPDQTAAVGGANFALGLLRGAAKPDATTILSPYSALLALGMAANGAGGRTLEEMEYALGAKLDDLNAWLASCRAAEDGEVVSANSIWTRNGTVQLLPEFRQTMEQKYGAEVHAGDLSVAAINEWVDSNTKGRIKKLLEQDDPSIVTYLINAMTFDAEWASPYEPQSCSEGTFHASDGTEQTVTYLSGEERGYLEVAGATGFVKHYSGGRYSFAGLLPAEGSTPEELLEALDGATLLNALCEPQAKKVYTRMPKFTASTTASLRPVLEAMGMQTALYGRGGFLPAVRYAPEDRRSPAEDLSAGR